MVTTTSKRIISVDDMEVANADLRIILGADETLRIAFME